MEQFLHQHSKEIDAILYPLDGVSRGCRRQQEYRYINVLTSLLFQLKTIERHMAIHYECTGQRFCARIRHALVLWEVALCEAGFQSVSQNVNINHFSQEFDSKSIVWT